MTAAFVIYATVLQLYFSQAFPQHSNDGSFSYDTEFDFPDFVLPSRTSAKASVRAGKPRSPFIASVNQQNVVTPVPILKQINRHNENGSYTYGFESADGSFKIETKLATGEVIGKYGYVDDRGKLRVVEYGANKYGFQPTGEGITTPPININKETDSERFEDTNIGHFASKPEVVKISSKPTNPKRKSQKPTPLTKTHPGPPQYLVQEPEESVRIETARPLITPSDINALQFIFGSDLRELQNNPTFKMQHTSKFASSPHKFEEHTPRESERPPFVANFPIPTIFDVIPLPSRDLPRSKSPQVGLPSDGSSKTLSAKNSKNKGKPKLNPQLVVLTAAEETPNPVRRSSISARNVHEGRSILDELMKQYAIPNRSPAISDFSFSYIPTKY